MMRMSGRAPPATSTTSAMVRASGSVCGTSQDLSPSGSATVADRPTVLRPGACRLSPAIPSDSRSPRFDVTSACSSSRTTTSSSEKKRSACRSASSSATCSGVVSRMSGGMRFWRWRRFTGVSPVRVSTLIRSPISATGASRLRAMSTASAFSGEM